jgi:hypothetical protein
MDTTALKASWGKVVAKTPCNGRPNGKISESTIGGIAAVTKPIPRLTSMKASTGCRASPRTEADAFMIRRSQMEGRTRRSPGDRSVVLEALRRTI